MSPRIIQLPLSGRDRRHYVRELRAAEQAHRDLPAKVEEAYRAAHALACHEWSVRQFIGGPAEPRWIAKQAIGKLLPRCLRRSAFTQLISVVGSRRKKCAHSELFPFWPKTLSHPL